MLIDTHCHLDFPELQKDFADVLLRAQETGVEKIINPGVGIEESRKAVGLAKNNDVIFAAVGLHPHEADSLTDNVFSELEELAQSEKVVAIGEIGLDFFRLQGSGSRDQEESKQLQKKVLEQQLELAEKTNKPAIIHSHSEK